MVSRAFVSAVLLIGTVESFTYSPRFQHTLPHSNFRREGSNQPPSLLGRSLFGSLGRRPKATKLRMQEQEGRKSVDQRESEEPAPSFMRLVRTDDRWFELQCAVVTYESRGEQDFKVDLVPMVHVADPQYYRTIQKMTEGHSRVLFELITDKSAVRTDAGGRRRLKERLFAPQDQRLLAATNGLQAQMEGLDYSGAQWFLADLDKETIGALQKRRGEGAPVGWWEASVLGWGAGKFHTIPRRCYTLIRQWLRGPLWLVPCPEGAMLCLDWALSSRGTVSEVVTAMLDALLQLDASTIRKLSFAQLLVSGAQLCDGPQTVIISERNQVAEQELRRAKEEGCGRTALLYGGLHAPDLDARLTNHLGMERVAVKWMPAWRIAVPHQRFEESASRLAFASTAYLGLAAFDWMSTISQIAQESSQGEWDGAAVLAGAYLLRHAVVYWQLGRWLVAWDQPLFVEAAARLEDGARLDLTLPPSPAPSRAQPDADPPNQPDSQTP